MNFERPQVAGVAPLAARMRPRTLEEVVGQRHLTAIGMPLERLAQSEVASSLSNSSVILWGPPGTGKTSIAQAIAQQSNRSFKELSAVTAGVKEIRDIVSQARGTLEAYQKETVLFLDEIHRFSKSQQDSLLPAVEAGWVVLIAATSENPSYSVIAPLLSRSLVQELQPLSPEDLSLLLERALASERGLNGGFKLSDGVMRSIVSLANGDARRALTILEAAAQHTSAKTKSKRLITAADVEAVISKALVRYDRQGDQHYDVISAFIKSVRGSDADAAIMYLARMIEAGEDPRFIARRLVILAAEDIGLADPAALTLAVSAADAAAYLGLPEARIPLAEATIYLALAPKSNSAYLAIDAALESIRRGEIGEVPQALQSGSRPGENTRDYKYPHDDNRGIVEQQYLPEKFQAARFYFAKEHGDEKIMAERWSRIRAILRGKS